MASVGLLAGSAALAALLESFVAARGENQARDVAAPPAAPARANSAVETPVSVAPKARRPLRIAPVRAPRSPAQVDDVDSEPPALGANTVLDMDFTRDASAQRPLAAKSTLRINSRPWSQLFVDGRLVGTTPQLALEVQSGQHDILLVNREFGMTKSFRVEVGPGESVTRVETLED